MDWRKNIDIRIKTWGENMFIKPECKRDWERVVIGFLTMMINVSI